MKLQKPIVLTMTDVRQAIWLMMYLTESQPMPIHQNAKAMQIPSNEYDDSLSTRGQIERQLKEQGIEWNTWLPLQPFKIADRECTFNADGTVKLSCGTVISNEAIAEFLKRRDEAERSNYLYWLDVRYGFGKRAVYRAPNKSDVGEFFESGAWTKSSGVAMESWQSVGGCKPITRADAIQIVGAENIDR
jgi:hypothetical protein